LVHLDHERKLSSQAPFSFPFAIERQPPQRVRALSLRRMRILISLPVSIELLYRQFPEDRITLLLVAKLRQDTSPPPFAPLFPSPLPTISDQIHRWLGANGSVGFFQCVKVPSPSILLYPLPSFSDRIQLPPNGMRYRRYLDGYAGFLPFSSGEEILAFSSFPVTFFFLPWPSIPPRFGKTGILLFFRRLSCPPSTIPF